MVAPTGRKAPRGEELMSNQFPAFVAKHNVPDIHSDIVKNERSQSSGSLPVLRMELMNRHPTPQSGVNMDVQMFIERLGIDPTIEKPFLTYEDGTQVWRNCSGIYYLNLPNEAKKRNVDYVILGGFQRLGRVV